MLDDTAQVVGIVSGLTPSENAVALEQTVSALAGANPLHVVVARYFLGGLHSAAVRERLRNASTRDDLMRLLLIDTFIASSRDADVRTRLGMLVADRSVTLAALVDQIAVEYARGLLLPLDAAPDQRAFVPLALAAEEMGVDEEELCVWLVNHDIPTLVCIPQACLSGMSASEPHDLWLSERRQPAQLPWWAMRRAMRPSPAETAGPLVSEPRVVARGVTIPRSLLLLVLAVAIGLLAFLVTTHLVDGAMTVERGAAVGGAAR